MKALLSLFVALAAAASLCGCLSSPGGLAPSTRPITGKDSYVVIQEGVTGGEGTVGLIAIPLWPTSAYDALQAVKAKYQADALINVSIENKTWWPLLLPIVTYHKLEIKGDAIKFKQGERGKR
jgi:hypothetical protein